MIILNLHQNHEAESTHKGVISIFFLLKTTKLYLTCSAWHEIGNGKWKFPNNFHAKHIICRALTGTFKIIFMIITSAAHFFKNTP